MRRVDPVTHGDVKLRHDVRNQLGIILGFAEILIAGTSLTDPRRADLEEIHKAAAAALELVGWRTPFETDVL